MPDKFKMLKDSKIEPTVKAGDIVYRCAKYDYGLARDDSRMLGFECISVTKKADGDYPYFVVPRHDVEKLQ